MAEGREEDMMRILVGGYSCLYVFCLCKFTLQTNHSLTSSPVLSLPPSIASDNHVGYAENDPVRCGDSLESFEEILSIAKEKDVRPRGK